MKFVRLHFLLTCSLAIFLLSEVRVYASQRLMAESLPQPIKIQTLSRCFKPLGDYAKEVSKEISRASRPVTKLNLQGKPFLFASKESIFDKKIATAFVQSLPKEIKIVDLSMNRLPQRALVTFSPLLERDVFQFLDVRMNSGANSKEALHDLYQVLSDKDLDKKTIAEILAKVIWIPSESLEYEKSRGILKDRYYVAHQTYDSVFCKKNRTWELPA